MIDDALLKARGYFKNIDEVYRFRDLLLSNYGDRIQTYPGPYDGDEAGLFCVRYRLADDPPEAGYAYCYGPADFAYQIEGRGWENP